jgi:hypothetical protein
MLVPTNRSASLSGLSSLSLCLTLACSPATPATDAGTDVGARVDAPSIDTGALADVPPTDTGAADYAPAVSDAGADDAPSGEDAPPVAVTLANVPSPETCGSLHAIAPVIPDEVGHYAAVRLRPPSYPFVVEQISYDLLAPAGTPCDASFEHEVRLIVSSSPTPPAQPSTDGTLVATAVGAASGSETRTLVLDLPESVRLEDGEYLYVAVKLTGDASHALCIGACATGTPLSDVDYWSNAAAEPYAWADMIDDFGFTYNYTIRARGHAL